MAALSPEEKRAGEKKILDECKVSTKGTDNDVTTILDREIPKNYNGKCLLKCAHEKIGIVRKNLIFVFDHYGNNFELKICSRLLMQSSLSVV